MKRSNSIIALLFIILTFSMNIFSAEEQVIISRTELKLQKSGTWIQKKYYIDNPDDLLSTKPISNLPLAINSGGSGYYIGKTLLDEENKRSFSEKIIFSGRNYYGVLVPNLEWNEIIIPLKIQTTIKVFGLRYNGNKNQAYYLSGDHWYGQYRTPLKIASFTKDEQDSRSEFTYTDNSANISGALDIDKLMVRISREQKDFDLYNQNNLFLDFDSNIGAFIGGSGDYIDYVFDKNTDETKVYNEFKLIYSAGDRKFSVEGLNPGNYKIQLYTFRDINSSGGASYRVVTNEGIHNFTIKDKEEIPVVRTGEEQIILSRVAGAGIKNTASLANYKLVGLTPSSRLPKVISNNKFGEVVDGDNTWDSSNSRLFTEVETNQYGFSGAETPLWDMIMIPVNGHTTYQSGSLEQYTENVNSGGFTEVKYYLNETFFIPTRIKNLVDNSTTTKNIFTYDEELENKIKTLEELRYREIMFRISRKDKTYDIYEQANGIMKAEEGTNASTFLADNSQEKYIDFVFTEGVTSTVEASDVVARYYDGRFEILGLNAEEYMLQVYTFKYFEKSDFESNYAVITKEGQIDSFTGVAEGAGKAYIYDIDSKDFPLIKFTVRTNTDYPLDSVVISSAVEKRNSDSMAFTTSLTKDIVEENQAESKYKYNWSGEYTTTLAGEEANEREILLDLTLSGEQSEIVTTTSSSIVTTTEEGIITTTESSIITVTTSPAITTEEAIIVTTEEGIITTTGEVIVATTEEVITPVVENVTDVSGIYIEPANLDIVLGYPHQKLIYLFNPIEIFQNGDYIADDNVYIPGRRAYRGIKTAFFSIWLSTIDDTIDVYLEDVYSYTNFHNFNYDNRKWEQSNIHAMNGLLIEKVASSSRLEFKYNGINKLVADLKLGASEFNKNQTDSDKIELTWVDSDTGRLEDLGSSEVPIDKVIFRIQKIETSVVENPVLTNVLEDKAYEVNGNTYYESLPKFYFDFYRKENLVEHGDPNIVSGTDTQADLYFEQLRNGDRDYVDIIFESHDGSQTQEFNADGATFTYDPVQKKLIISKLAIGTYFIQLYTIKSSEKYKIIDYGGYNIFTMDIPDIAGDSFAAEKNIYKIDYITSRLVEVTNAEGFKEKKLEVKVNFLTKAREQLSEEQIEESIRYAGKNELLETKYLPGSGTESDIVPTYSIVENLDGRISYPVEIIFAIDNSGSMGNEISKVAEGLSEFSDELARRKFAVRYNLITFGPTQTSYRLNSISVHEKKDWYNNYGYLAIFNEKWYTDSEGGVTTLKSDLEKIADRAGGGYFNSEENTAHAIYYAQAKLRDNLRYLDIKLDITLDANEAFLPSKKMIIFLTDENMDSSSRLKNLNSNYDSSNIVANLYSELSGNLNGRVDNIKLVGIFHIGKNKTDKLGHAGVTPADTGDIYLNKFEESDAEANAFTMYEMGSSGQHVYDALMDAINDLGFIQSWEMTYYSPYPEYDGTVREVDFDILDLFKEAGTGDDLTYAGDSATEKEDRQYIVPEDKIQTEFESPDENEVMPYLKIVGTGDSKEGRIHLLAKSKYFEVFSDGQPRIVENIISGGKFEIIGPSGTVIKEGDNVLVQPSDLAWVSFKVDNSSLTTILSDREEYWYEVEEADIGNGIPKARYKVVAENSYQLNLRKSEYESIVGLHNSALTYDYYELKFKNIGSNIPGGSSEVIVKIAKENFKSILNSKDEKWYEIVEKENDNPAPLPVLDESIGYEYLGGGRHRIKLRISEVQTLINSQTGSKTFEIKINKKEEDYILNGAEVKDLADEGWYDVKTTLNMEDFGNLGVGDSDEDEIDIKAWASTEALTKEDEILDVRVDIHPPELVGIEVKILTQEVFYENLKTITKAKIVEEFTKYYSYNVIQSDGINSKLEDRSNIESLVTGKDGIYVKEGDVVLLKLKFSEKNYVKDLASFNSGVNGTLIELETDSDDYSSDTLTAYWVFRVTDTSDTGSIKIKLDMKDDFGNNITERINEEIKVLYADNSDSIELVFDRSKLSNKSEYSESTGITENYIKTGNNYSIESTLEYSDHRGYFILLGYDKEESDNKVGNISSNYNSINSGKNFYGFSTTNKWELENSSDGSLDGEYIVRKGLTITKAGKVTGVDYIDKYNYSSLATSLSSNSDIFETELNSLDIANTYTENRLAYYLDNIEPRINIGGISTTTYKTADELDLDITLVDENILLEADGDSFNWNLSVTTDGQSMTKEDYSKRSSSNENNLKYGVWKKIDVTGNPFKITYWIDVFSEIEKTFTFNVADIRDKADNIGSQSDTFKVRDSHPYEVQLKLWEDSTGNPKGVGNWYNQTSGRTGERKKSPDGIYTYSKGGAGTGVTSPEVYINITAPDSSKYYSSDMYFEEVSGLYSFSLGEYPCNSAICSLDIGKPISLSLTPYTENKRLVEKTGTLTEEIVRTYADNKTATLNLIIDNSAPTSIITPKIEVTNGKLDYELVLEGVKEISGVKGYDIFLSGADKNYSSSNINGKSQLQLGTDNGLSNVEIEEDGISKSTTEMSITIWDYLGHESIFEYIINHASQVGGNRGQIRSTVEGSARERSSVIRVQSNDDDGSFRIRGIEEKGED